MIMIGSKGNLENRGKKVTLTNQPTLSLWYMKPGNSQWTHMADMVFNQHGHFDSVYDISWCALNGRSFHYVVSCGVEGVFIWKFKTNSNNTIDILDVKSFRVDQESVPVLVSWNLMVRSY